MRNAAVRPGAGRVRSLGPAKAFSPAVSTGVRRPLSPSLLFDFKWAPQCLGSSVCRNVFPKSIDIIEG